MCAKSGKPIAADLTQLTYTWQVIPVTSALIEVGIPNLIPLDGSGVDVLQLAQKTHVDAELLYKYMRYVSSLGVFRELPDRHFAHTESSKELFPGHLTFYTLLFFGSARGGMLPAAEFGTQLRDPSKPALEHAHKMSMWQMFAQSPQLEKHFADYMNVFANLMLPGILQTIRLPETGTVADIGGGNGHVLLEFLKANPNLTGVLYELPTVAKMVDEGLKNPNPPSDSLYSKFSVDVKKRVNVVAGDYTDSSQLNQIADADVFFLKWIFHDNDDFICRKLLAHLFQIMKLTSKIIICDVVFKPTPNEWKFPITMDLVMAVSFNSKERTQEEWTQLLSTGEG